MSAAVELVADGEVRVGDVTYPGGLLPDGRVTLLGVTVRPLRLAERDRLVALVVGLVPGDDEARTLARLVLTAASAPGDALPTGDDARAAVEAVALHLAGATLDGPLVRTRLLAGRSAGSATDDLTAAEADLLAAELATVVVADEGWTRLVLDEPDAHGGSPRAVRDRLATALLARATQPLDPALGRALLGGPDVPFDDVSPGWGALAHDPGRYGDGQPSPYPADAPGSVPTTGLAAAQAGERAPLVPASWSAPPATQPIATGPGAAPVRTRERATGSPGTSAHADRTATTSLAPDAQPTTGTPAASTASRPPQTAAAGPHVSAERWTPRWTPRSTAQRADSGRSGARPAAGGPAGVDRWGSPVPAPTTSPAGAFVGLDPSVLSVDRAALSARQEQATAQPARTGAGPWATSRPTPPSTPAPASSPRPLLAWSTTADDLAHELQRAADLRGLHR